jgi:hypothetical protein
MGRSTHPTRNCKQLYYGASFSADRKRRRSRRYTAAEMFLKCRRVNEFVTEPGTFLRIELLDRPINHPAHPRRRSEIAMVAQPDIEGIHPVDVERDYRRTDRVIICRQPAHREAIDASAGLSLFQARVEILSTPIRYQSPSRKSMRAIASCRCSRIRERCRIYIQGAVSGPVANSFCCQAHQCKHDVVCSNRTGFCSSPFRSTARLR